MIIVIASLVVLAALSFLGGWYFRTLRKSIDSAKPVWTRLAGNLDILAKKQSVPEELRNELTIAAALSGCGCFILMLASPSEKSKDDSSAEGIRKVLETLPRMDRQLVASIVRDIVLFDSIRSPVLRHLVSHRASFSVIKESEEGRIEEKKMEPAMIATHSVVSKPSTFQKIQNKQLACAI